MPVQASHSLTFGVIQLAAYVNDSKLFGIQKPFPATVY